jgi:nucleoid-associated protein YgaU
MAVTAQFAKAQFDLREPVAGKHSFSPGGSISLIKFLFNPKDYSMSLQSGWNFKPQKKSAEPPEFTGHQMRSLDVEVFLDATDTANGTVADAVESLFATVRPTEKSVSAGTPFPPIVVFSWGDSRPFVGVVKSVSATLTLFRPSGQPVRATCKVSMQEFAPGPEGQNPTSGALRSNRSHQVLLGDSLASIATREYGNPNLWRAIAKVNELDDPFRLRVGAELLIPAPADAAALA